MLLPMVYVLCVYYILSSMVYALCVYYMLLPYCYLTSISDARLGLTAWLSIWAAALHHSLGGKVRAVLV